MEDFDADVFIANVSSSFEAGEITRAFEHMKVNDAQIGSNSNFAN